MTINRKYYPSIKLKIQCHDPPPVQSWFIIVHLYALSAFEEAWVEEHRLIDEERRRRTLMKLLRYCPITDDVIVWLLLFCAARVVLVWLVAPFVRLIVIIITLVHYNVSLPPELVVIDLSKIWFRLFVCSFWCMRIVIWESWKHYSLAYYHNGAMGWKHGIQHWDTHYYILQGEF